MQQKLVYLHTSKDIDETESILKEQGMEIIFKAYNFYLELEQMNEEEKISWFNSIKGDFGSSLVDTNEAEINIKILLEQNTSLKKSLKEIMNLFSTEPNKQFFLTKYDELLSLVELYNKKINILQDNSSNRRDSSIRLYRTRLQTKAECSCLIARQEGNVLRFLSFEEDPVISISGPNANSLKSTLESKF